MTELNDYIRKKSVAKVSAGVGGTIIMVIFVVLCLTIFAVLSFTAAHSDMKLSNKTLDMTRDYYKIQADAETKLSEIYAVINSSGVTDAIGNIEGIEVSYTGDNETQVYYECHGEQNQKICVTLKLKDDEASGRTTYDILSWNLANIDVPEYEGDLIDLWEGSVD